MSWLYFCLTSTCFRLFTQVHLWIDVSVEGMFPACCFRQRIFSNFAWMGHMNGAPNETRTHSCRIVSRMFFFKFSIRLEVPAFCYIYLFPALFLFRGMFQLVAFRGSFFISPISIWCLICYNVFSLFYIGSLCLSLCLCLCVCVSIWKYAWILKSFIYSMRIQKFT